MAATLVVDGYNAINAVPSTRRLIIKGRLEEARKEIMAIAREYARSSGFINNVCVVFDGDDKYRQMDRLSNLPGDHVFSGTDKGDDKIIETVKRYASFSRVIVASNDNYVRNMSRGYGASLMAAEDLAPKKETHHDQPSDKEQKLDKKTKDSITEDYMKELGLD